MRSSLYAFDCRGSGPYPRHENPDDFNLSASRLASILLTIPGSLAASAASVKATTHETLRPSGAVTVTVAKMGLPSLSAVATTALPPSRRTRPCINSRRRVRPGAIVLYATVCRFGPGAALCASGGHCDVSAKERCGRRTPPVWKGLRRQLALPRLSIAPSPK